MSLLKCQLRGGGEGLLTSKAEGVDVPAWGPYCLAWMGWAASYSFDATLSCSALCRWLHLPA